MRMVFLDLMVILAVGYIRKEKTMHFLLILILHRKSITIYLEFGTGFSQHTVRGYGVFASGYAQQPDNLTETQKV